MYKIQKNILFCLIFLIPFMNLSSKAMYDAKDDGKNYGTVKRVIDKPGPEAWVDANNRPAPARVRRAADNLWDAVKKEGALAFDAGWVYIDRTEGCNKDRIACGIICCGLNELCCGLTRCCGSIELGWKYIPDTTGFFWDQKGEEVKRLHGDFMEIVNAATVRPENYVPDAQMCQLGDWVVDGVRSTNPEVLFERRSGRRDLSAIPADVMRFVNQHGGWVPEGTFNVQLTVDPI